MSLIIDCPVQLTQDHVVAHMQTMASALQEQWSASSAAQGASVQLNMAALQSFDSSALAVCMAWMRVAKDMGAVVTWAGVPAKLQSLAQLYGVRDVLGWEDASVTITPA